jgi:hypothetical protein
MDVFLVGFRLAAPTYTPEEFAARLAARGHGAALIRDWSSITTDDTRWGVVIDASDAHSISEAADELGVEITGTIRLVPDPEVRQPGADWAATMAHVLPDDPPPRLGDSIQGGGGGWGPEMALPPDLDTCGVCGWIGDHDPAVPHPNSF